MWLYFILNDHLKATQQFAEDVKSTPCKLLKGVKTFHFGLLSQEQN